MKASAWLLLALCTSILALPADAHKPSDAYLTLERQGQTLRGQWDIALRDMDAAIGLDADGDGDITWGEVRGRQREIAGYALSRLEVRSGGQPCAVRGGHQLIDHHTDGA